MVYYGLLLFFVLEYVRPNNYIPALNVLHLNSLVPAAVVVGTIVGRSRITHRDVWQEPNTKMIIMLLGLIVGSTLTADVTLYAYNVFTTVIGYVLIMWVITKQATDLRQIKGVAAVLVVVHLAVAALTPELFTNSEARPYLASGAFLGDGNDFALSVNLAIPFCLFLLFEAKAVRHRVFYSLALGVLILSVVGTSSRGGTLALAAMGFYFWLKSDKKVVTGLIAAGAIGLVVFFAPATYFDRMQTISSHQDGSAQGRIMAWKAGVRMALDHPVLGVGAGHFPVKFGVEYRPPGFVRGELPWVTAHSIYFVILGELGFPGLGLLLLFIGWNLLANRRLAREVLERNDEHSVRDTRLLACLSASLIAFAVGGAFLTAIYYPHMYILAGLLTVARRLVRERMTVSNATAPEWVESPASYHPALR